MLTLKQRITAELAALCEGFGFCAQNRTVCLKRTRPFVLLKDSRFKFLPSREDQHSGPSESAVPVLVYKFVQDVLYETSYN